MKWVTFHLVSSLRSVPSLSLSPLFLLGVSRQLISEPKQRRDTSCPLPWTIHVSCTPCYYSCINNIDRTVIPHLATASWISNLMFPLQLNMFNQYPSLIFYYSRNQTKSYMLLFTRTLLALLFLHKHTAQDIILTWYFLT